MAAIRTTLTDPALTRSVGEFLALEVIGQVLRRDDLPPEEANRRAGLVASQILGLLMGRYVLRMPVLANRRTEDLVAEIGPTVQVQRYVDGARSRTSALEAHFRCNFLRNDDHVLVIGITEHGGHAFEAFLDHGADPDVLAFDRGYIIVRPVDANRASSGELILRLLVRPIVDEPRPGSADKDEMPDWCSATTYDHRSGSVSRRTRWSPRAVDCSPPSTPGALPSPAAGGCLAAALMITSRRPRLCSGRLPKRLPRRSSWAS